MSGPVPSGPETKLDPNVPDEMRIKGLQLCKSFMGGAWLSVQPSDFRIARILGGLSNMMFLCTLPDHVENDVKTEPRKVLLRIYGKIIQENPETVVIDSVVFALLAEKKLGPQLYGVFTGGRVEQFVTIKFGGEKSRHLHTDELGNPAISSCCAKVLSDIHKQKMPLVKTPTWLWEIVERYLGAIKKMSFESEDAEKSRKLQQVVSFGLQTEYETMRSICESVQSPVVFCHNDFQEGNILYSEQTDDPRGWKLVPIDFEYSSYNFRGFDFANHFCEWCYNYEDQEEAPYYSADISAFPTKQHQEYFFEAYRQAIGAKSDDPSMSDDFMLKEAAAFTLASDFMWAAWSIVQINMSEINFGYLEYGLVRLEAYSKHKEAYLKQYSSS